MFFSAEYTDGAAPIYTNISNRGEDAMSDTDPVSTPFRVGDQPLPPEKEALATKIVSICWEQFGRGANIDIQHACYDRAISLGALERLRTRLNSPDPFTEQELSDAKWCSIKAGRVARKLVNKAPPPNGILLVTPDIFQSAFETVSEKIKKLNRKRREDNLSEILAVWCP